MTDATFDLASKVHPGEGRLWLIMHEPRKPKTPLRLELRATVLRDGKPPRLEFTEMVTYAETQATPEALEEAAQRLLEAQKFVGVFL
ncbi:MAG: hypothetical protein K0S70_80 [Microbacterium sp.]|jgi:hypothetical protein|nr:hypothetical protein [Microbacterium sp.]